MAVQTTYNSLHVTWQSPAYIDSELEHLLQFRIMVQGEEEEEGREIITDIGDQMSVTVNKLRHASQFSVSVSAFVPQFEIRDDLRGLETNFNGIINPIIIVLVLVESLSETVVVQTSPLPPVVVSASQVGLDRVTLHLQPPAELGMGTQIENFELKFSAMDENGTFIIENTEQSLYISPASLQVTVPYLLPGVIYSFQSKVDALLRSIVFTEY